MKNNVIMKRILFAAALGTCSAYGDIQIFEVDSVAALTNAIDLANPSPSDAGAAYDVIRLKAGVTFDLSTLSEYTSPDGTWGTMGAPSGNSNGKSCLWYKKKIHFEGEDATHWKAKTPGQESVLYGGNAARIIYPYGTWDGACSTFKHIVFANGKAESGKNGGGLFSLGPSIHSPTSGNQSKMGFVTNCVFRSCSAYNGGGSYSYNVYDSSFETCSAANYGGGAYGTGSSNYAGIATNRFDTCVFSGCTAGNGGGIYHNESSVIEGALAGYIAHCAFTNCTSSSGGGGVCLRVGGLVSDCQFVTNTCTGNNGGAICVEDNYRGTVVDCKFTDNFHTDQNWGRGGACMNVDCTRCTFSGRGDLCGGSFDRCIFDGVRDVQIFRTASAEPTVYATNCLIANCSAIYLGYTGVAAGGMEFVNCTFADNTIGVANTDYTNAQGEDDSLACMFYCNRGTVALKNCIFSGNKRKKAGAKTYYDSDLRLYANTDNGATIQISNSLFTKAESVSDYDWAEGANTLVQGNPRFVAGDAAYPGLPYYSILRKSLARNAGVNAAWMTGAVDLAGNQRIFDEVVDIGCYECHIIHPPRFIVIVR